MAVTPFERSVKAIASGASNNSPVATHEARTPLHHFFSRCDGDDADSGSDVKPNSEISEALTDAQESVISLPAEPASALPWSVSPCWDQHNNCAQIDSANIPCIAGAFYLGGTDNARENAAYIVHACNNYHKLLDALKDAHEWVDADDPMGAHLDIYIRDLLRELGEL